MQSNYTEKHNEIKNLYENKILVFTSITKHDKWYGKWLDVEQVKYPVLYVSIFSCFSLSVFVSFHFKIRIIMKQHKAKLMEQIICCPCLCCHPFF